MCSFFNNYRPQRSWAKVMFLQVCVILFTRGGVCLSACWNTTPPEQTPPWEQTPQSRHPNTRPPGSRHPPGADTPQTRHPPDQTHTPPGADTAPPRNQTPAYGQRAAGTHPTGMHSCLFTVTGNDNKMYSKNSIGNRNFHSKLALIVFQINSVGLIESEEFRETSMETSPKAGLDKYLGIFPY